MSMYDTFAKPEKHICLGRRIIDRGRTFKIVLTFCKVRHRSATNPDYYFLALSILIS